MTLEVVDSYGPSPYPYVLGSLSSSSRPASTESKATTTSACFFEVPHVNQNDDLMVRFSLLVPNGAAAADLMLPPFSKLYATFTKRRNARQSTIWYERLFCVGERDPLVLSSPIQFDVVTPPPSRVGTPVPERTATPLLDERGPKTQLILLNRKSSMPSVSSALSPSAGVVLNPNRSSHTRLRGCGD